MRFACKNTTLGGVATGSAGCENVRTPAGVVVGLHTLTKCRTESDRGVVSESDRLNANVLSRTSRMSLRIKRDRKMFVCRRTRELAESGRFSGWLSIEFELRYVEGHQQARIWLDDVLIREELDILCQQARSRERTPKSAGK